MAIERTANTRGTVTAPEPIVGVEAARAAARLAKQLEVALSDVDLSLPQYRALAYLSTGGQAPSVLAGQLAVSKPTITALIDGLVGRGYVARKPDQHDRRRVEHRLTSPGSSALTRADDAIRARLGRLAEHLEPDHAGDAVAGLASWNKALDTARALALDQATEVRP